MNIDILFNEQSGPEKESKQLHIPSLHSPLLLQAGDPGHTDAVVILIKIK